MIDQQSQTIGHDGSPRTQTLQLYTRPYDEPDQEDAPQTELFVDDPSNARATARAFLMEYGEGLRPQGKDWLAYNGRRYGLIGQDKFRAKFWTWLEERTAVAIKRNMVVNALDALADILRDDMPDEMPSWLDGRCWPEPDQVIAFENGLLYFDEDQTPKFLSHTPKWFSRNCLPHVFNPKATCPNWDDFLHQVFEGDGERIRALQQWFGYCLTSDTRQQKIAMLVGRPRAGKGTAMRVLSHMLGEENVSNPTFQRLGENFGLATLVGKSVAIVEDGHVGRNDRVTGILERLKSISGNDPQNVNRKYKDELSNVRLKVRFTLVVNELPHFPDASSALKYRLLVIPFNRSFAGEEDIHLQDRLLDEIPGITNWALRGLTALKSSDTGKLFQPKAGEQLLEDYALICSPVRQFVEDRCELGEGFLERRQTLFDAWQTWRREEGERLSGANQFWTQLQAAYSGIKKIKRGRDERGNQFKYYEGIRLRGRSEFVV